jgi:hypothetical protein
MGAISFDSYAYEPTRSAENPTQSLMVPDIVRSFSPIECKGLAMHLPEPA